MHIILLRADNVVKDDTAMTSEKTNLNKCNTSILIGCSLYRYNILTLFISVFVASCASPYVVSWLSQILISMLF